MALHLRSAVYSYIRLVLSTRQFVSYKSCICCISTLSNNSFEEDHKQVGTGSELGIVIASIHPGSSHEEVFRSLASNPSCETLKITHQLVDKLLFRFRDDWKSALGVFRWAQSHPGYEPLPEIYDKLVDTLGKMKQMDKMNAMVQEMHADNLVSKNTIAKVMRRFCGAGEWKEAIRIFDELENYGLEKNTETMNILLNSLCKEKRVEQARDVFLELKSHIQPNANTFNIFIYGWCKIYRIEEAYWTIQEMKGYGFRPCVISYTTIIQSYCEQFDFPKVYELLDEMQAQECAPNVVTFTSIMCSLTNSQMYEEALQIYERMESIGCKPDTLFFNAYIHTLGRAGQAHRAIRVFKFVMPVNGATPNTSTYNSMIAMFCHQEQEEKALEYLRHMENSPYCKPDVQSYSPLFKLYLRAGKFEACRQMLDDMVNKHHLSLDLATYALLIHGLCRGKKCEVAYLLFQAMIGKGITPRYQTCRLLLEEMKSKNMFDAAETIEEYMKSMKSSKKRSIQDHINTS
ncbi:hypothetical protein LIER_12775 [Lithospermum erythrorhizon]|uniref:PROP1-like PPR domain-containing protein n=1 Tax=Lithospermum erythrorhizon TaxID=34254 RepID=A0AAV3PV59_LITER